MCKLRSQHGHLSGIYSLLIYCDPVDAICVVADLLGGFLTLAITCYHTYGIKRVANAANEEASLATLLLYDGEHLFASIDVDLCKAPC